MAKTNSMLRRILRLPAELVVGVYVIVDGVIAPLFRPLMRFLSSLRIIQRIEHWIASLPPYVILVLLVVPFAIAELAKAFAVILMGTGHFRTGITIFIGAYIVSILVCERTFHAGRAQLMTIGWFAKLFNWVMAYKDRMLAWFKTTEVWKAATAFKQSMRETLRRAKAQIGMILNGTASWLSGR